ncbi:MAG TPA: hypothetical protein VMT61_15240 [Candidatus Binataceae bacterium]|nr:hypothetical protein [Candidatus Binataceae bacterium]
MRFFIALTLLGLIGCANLSSADLKPADAAQTTAPPDASTIGKPKQWFTTDTPETLPKDKLDKMTLTGGGFAGY